MNELVKITETNGKQAVSARELYEKLGYNTTHWAKWYRKNITDNEFAIEHIDYEGFALSANGNETKDFSLSIDFAKRIAMMARTEVGEKIRNYFIEIEKTAISLLSNTPKSKSEILTQAFKILEEQVEQERQEKLNAINQIKVLAPKAIAHDMILNSNDLVSVSQAAKIVFGDVGRNKFFKQLRADGILFKNSNEPRQEYVERGFFKIKEIPINTNHGTFMKMQTFITQSGLSWLCRKYGRVLTQEIQFSNQ